MRKGTNEKQAGKLKTGLSMCKAFSPSLFRISYKIHLPPGKKEIRRQIQENIQKRRPKKTTTTTTTQFLEMENPKSSPRTQSPTRLVGKKQGTLAKETKLTEGCKVTMH